MAEAMQEVRVVTSLRQLMRARREQRVRILPRMLAEVRRGQYLVFSEATPDTIFRVHRRIGLTLILKRAHLEGRVGEEEPELRRRPSTCLVLYEALPKPRPV